MPPAVGILKIPCLFPSNLWLGGKRHETPLTAVGRIRQASLSYPFAAGQLPFDLFFSRRPPDFRPESLGGRRLPTVARPFGPGP